MYAPRLLLFISGLELSYETAAQNHAVAGGVTIGAAAVDSGLVSAAYLLVGESQSYIHSVYAKRAIIAAEDANFAEHDGVDWEALQKAYEKNAKKGKVVSGGSTITQQLAKNLFLSGQRSYLRKAEEMAITFMLEMVMDKRRIFEIYLNVIELGSGVFGAEAGAQRYFGVSAAALGPSEAARLAVMLPNPRYFGKHMDSNYLARRSALIQQRMSSSDLP